jgi:beta-glucosidase
MNFEQAKRKVYNIIGKAINSIAQNEAGNTSDIPKTVTDGAPELICKAGIEGSVLLRNDDVLPFKKTDKISVFGRCQYDWFYVGYGSGGDVIKPYTVSLIEGLENLQANLNEPLKEKYKAWCQKNPPDHGFWGHWPHYYNEMPISEDEIKSFSSESECAVVIIGRSAGEDRENYLKEGSFLLTEDEKNLINNVTKHFKKTAILLNTGNVISLYDINLIDSDLAILMCWQGGMESGNSVAKMLLGEESPSGKLTDTIAYNYEDYPCSENFGYKEYTNYVEDIFVGYRYFETFHKEKVLYPFGFGLFYTTFKQEFLNAELVDDEITLQIKVTNTGAFKCKDVVQVYVNAPQGELGKAEKVLVGFNKTKELAPDESDIITIKFPLYFCASYDDSGKTGNKSCYVLESGIYKLFVGDNVRDAVNVWNFTLDNLKIINTLSEVCAPKNKFERMIATTNGNGELTEDFENAPLATTKLRDIILKKLPEEIPYTGDRGIKLTDVKSGKNTLDEFIAQLNTTELEAISRGHYTMDSPLGNKGNAGAFGGVTQSLRAKKVPPIVTTDGPSGIRIRSCCSLLPNGTALACTWNTDLVKELYTLIGNEMKEKGSDVLLAPGMNIHRSMLCGRNFEYFSEDPVISGKIASAVVSGVQSAGVSACPKHFACNNQETNRTYNDSRVSERALREIYLKGFEICVKEAKPLNIMTSYNKINGVWGHYHYELCTMILRNEWGYTGNVMTDWWMRSANSHEFPQLRDNAYRVRSGVDVLMPGGKRSGRKKPDGTLLETYKKENGITLGEMQQVARNVLNLCLKLDK